MLSKENKEKISLMMQSMNIEDIIELKKLLDSRKENCYQEMISKLDRLKIERKRMTDEIITPLGGVCPNKEITDRKIGVRPAITVRI